MSKYYYHAKKIGSIIKKHREKIGTPEEFLAKCAYIALNNPESGEYKDLSLRQLSYIENGEFVDLDEWKVDLLSNALGIAASVITGNVNSKLVFADPVADPVYGKKISNLLFEFGVKAKEFVAWSGFLPCSLETITFMEQHHKGRYGQGDFAKEAKQRLVQRYNEIGLARYRNIQGDNEEDARERAKKRSWTFYQLMVFKDIERIAKRDGEYKYISKKDVQQCFDNVVSIITKPFYKVNLIIANGDETDLPNFGQYDSILSFDKNFVLSRDLDSGIFYSAKKEAIQTNLKALERFRQLATYKNQEEVVEKLKILRESVR